MLVIIEALAVREIAPVHGIDVHEAVSMYPPRFQGLAARESKQQAEHRG